MSAPAVRQPLMLLPLRMLSRLESAMHHTPMRSAMPEVMPYTSDGTSLPMPRTFDGGYSLSPHHTAS